MVNFDTDEEEKEYEINCKTREITDQFRDAEAILKRFSKNDDMDPNKDNASELKVRNNIQRAVAKRLQSLSMSFRKSQKVGV